MGKAEKIHKICYCNGISGLCEYWRFFTSLVWIFPAIKSLKCQDTVGWNPWNSTRQRCFQGMQNLQDCTSIFLQDLGFLILKKLLKVPFLVGNSEWKPKGFWQAGKWRFWGNLNQISLLTLAQQGKHQEQGEKSPKYSYFSWISQQPVLTLYLNQTFLSQGEWELIPPLRPSLGQAQSPALPSPSLTSSDLVKKFGFSSTRKGNLKSNLVFSNLEFLEMDDFSSSGLR